MTHLFAWCDMLAKIGLKARHELKLEKIRRMLLIDERFLRGVVDLSGSYVSVELRISKTEIVLKTKPPFLPLYFIRFLLSRLIDFFVCFMYNCGSIEIHGGIIYEIHR